MEQRAILDVVFAFHYARPRILLTLSGSLVVSGIWIAIHPSEIDVGHATGGIDLFIRSLPLSARSITCCAMAVYFSWGAYVTWWPCIRDTSIVIFDGRRIHGYDVWGHKTSLLRSKVDAISYRYGGASVKAGADKVWVPLSLLNTDKQHLMSVKSFLNDAASISHVK